MTNEEKEDQRLRFESAIKKHWNSSPKRSPYRLETLTINGRVDRYMDPDTDNAWIGFQLAEYIGRKSD